MENENKELMIHPDELRQERGVKDDNLMPFGQDTSQLVQTLLSNEHIPEHLRKKAWVLFSQSLKLSFINNDDLNWFMMNWELLRLTIIESMPKSSYDEEFEDEMISCGMEFKANLLRARGSGRLNERELLGASTQASFSSLPINSTANNPSFLDKVANIFR